MLAIFLYCDAQGKGKGRVPANSLKWPSVNTTFDFYFLWSLSLVGKNTRFLFNQLFLGSSYGHFRSKKGLGW